MLLKVLNYFSFTPDFLVKKSNERLNPETDLPDIELKNFIDLDMDIVGVYALGHHNKRPFLEAVRKREPQAFPSEQRIRWTWALFSEKNDFMEVYEPVAGAQPVTLIELYD